MAFRVSRCLTFLRLWLKRFCRLSKLMTIPVSGCRATGPCHCAPVRSAVLLRLWEVPDTKFWPTARCFVCLLLFFSSLRQRYLRLPHSLLKDLLFVWIIILNVCTCVCNYTLWSSSMLLLTRYYSSSAAGGTGCRELSVVLSCLANTSADVKRSVHSGTAYSFKPYFKSF